MNEKAWKPENNHEELEMLEAEARKELGDETVDSRLDDASNEIVQVIGWGDMPPGYDPDRDPLHRKRKEVAKEITIKAIAATLGIAVVGGAIVYVRKRMQEQSEDNPGEEDEATGDDQEDAPSWPQKEQDNLD